MNREEELAQLRELLFAEELDRLRELQRQVEDASERVTRLSGDLSAAFRQANGTDPDLAPSMEAPVVECIHNTVRKDGQVFADALFPVIGPAIRKSIAEALKAFSDTVNRTVEYGLSPKGIKLRIKAARQGISLTELILSETLIYRVDAVLLIERDSGLLIAHAGHPEALRADEEAVSAMLTAIADFVQDTVQEGDGAALDSVQLGDHTVWVERGPQASLAAFVRGVPSVEVREILCEALEDIHRQFGEELREFDGDRTGMEPVAHRLEACLVEREVEASDDEKSPDILLPAIGGLLVLALLIWWIFEWRWEAVRERLVEALRATPGVVITNISELDDVYLIEGLRDPLADAPARILEQAEVDSDDVRFALRPHISLEDPIVARRASERFELTPEDQWAVEDGILTLWGGWPPQTLERLQREWSLVTGLQGLDLSRARTQWDDSELAAALQDALLPPTGVALTVEDGVVYLAGEAPSRWIAMAGEALRADPRVRAVDGSALHNAEQLLLDEAVNGLESLRIDFASGLTLSEPALVDVAVRAMAAIANLVPGVRIKVLGHTDISGSAELNARLRERRAARMVELLRQRGVEVELVPSAADPGHPAGRFVSFEVDR